jgi:hypothetical protein
MNNLRGMSRSERIMASQDQRIRALEHNVITLQNVLAHIVDSNFGGKVEIGVKDLMGVSGQLKSGLSDDKLSLTFEVIKLSEGQSEILKQ